jgi:type I restriction enzyme R subunit
MPPTKEQDFESAIVASLIEHGGYVQGQSADYSPELGLFKDEVLAFLHSTQPRSWARIAAIHGDAAADKVIHRLCQEMDLRGSLDVLRNGFTDYGVKFRMASFQPESGLNPETAELYRCNRLRVCRQVFYSSSNQNSVDLVLALNGVPVATLELKNHFTGQNADHAKRQYASSRDSRELLFAFKKRALVHFAVDADEVWMTTRLDGSQTFWLPFNRGHDHGKGNPPATGYKTAYLWEEILRKDSLMEILQRFVHLHVEEKQTDSRTAKKEKLIFPRFHQLDAVRKITGHVRTHGAGKNYLIQHSAGSGKSNTIAWLAYRLASLHNAASERIFDAVVLVTDRRLLDHQLQTTVYQFEHKTGVVQRIDKGSSQLAEALQQCVPVIITTLQKFPFIIDKIGELPERRYAVIIDEAHSSQGGEASNKMKAVLAAQSLEEAEQQEAADYDPEDEIRKVVEQSCAARGKHKNLSFFCLHRYPEIQNLGGLRPAGQPRQAATLSPLFHAAGD